MYTMFIKILCIILALSTVTYIGMVKAVKVTRGFTQEVLSEAYVANHTFDFTLIHNQTDLQKIINILRRRIIEKNAEIRGPTRIREPFSKFCRSFAVVRPVYT
jgi:hypothetical protein